MKTPEGKWGTFEKKLMDGAVPCNDNTLFGIVKQNPKPLDGNELGDELVQIGSWQKLGSIPIRKSFFHLDHN